MNKIEIENCLMEIMAECDFFTDKNPLTYIVFLNRYSHMLDSMQIANTQEIINNLKSEMHAYNNMNLKKFEHPLCKLPLHEREDYVEEMK